MNFSLGRTKTYGASKPSKLQAGRGGDAVGEDAQRHSLCALHFEYVFEDAD